MKDMLVRLKGGREFRFKCKEYRISRINISGAITEFEYKGGIGECPVYLRVQDIECIAEIAKGAGDDKEENTGRNGSVC